MNWRRLAALFLALAAPYLASANDPPSQEEKDFYLGSIVGACFSVKCEVFSGNLVIETARSGQPVSIAIREWLHGDLPGGKTVEVPFEKRPAGQRCRSDSLCSVWNDVYVTRNAPVTVVRGLERVPYLLGGLRAGDPVLVTGDKAQGETIRSLVKKAELSLGSAGKVTEQIASLSGSHDAALAGFLWGYLYRTSALPHRERLELLSQMIGNPGVPPRVWHSLVFTFGMCAWPEDRQFVVNRLVEIARQPGDFAAITALEGVAIEAQSGVDSLRALIPQDVRAHLAADYFRLVQSKQLQQNILVEETLDLQRTPPRSDRP